MKECCKCKKELSLGSFYKNKRKIDGLQDYCKSCKKEFDKNYYIKNKPQYIQYYKGKQRERASWLKEYKQGLCCSKCGDNRYYILDFHHLDPKEKEIGISDAVARSFKTLKREIEKCIPLCRNCHSEFHYLEKRDGLKISDYI